MNRQDFAERILSAHLKTGRLAHAYLITGEKDSGKEAVALAFAKALNCREKHYFESCSCSSCHKIEGHLHPDISWIGEDLSARSIKIEDIRRMIDAVGLKPYEGMRKVFILVDSGRLTPDASHALLKTLEEPPPETVILLLAESREQLLETIRSRTFEVRLRPSEKGCAEEQNAVDFWNSERKRGGWDAVLEAYQTQPREEVRKALDSLVLYVHAELRRSVSSAASQSDADSRWLNAMDAVWESKEALQGNANQKLVLTRLAIQLKNVV